MFYETAIRKKLRACHLVTYEHRNCS